MSKKILVIVGTTRQNRSSDKVAAWLQKNAPASKNLELELVDLRDWSLPIFDEPMPPLASQGQYQNELAVKWGEKIQSADGYIIITSEYNHSIPGVLKNAMDYWYSAWTQGKPVSFVSYGAGAGGVRAVEHLRQVCSELKMMDLHNEVNIVNIWAAFNEDGSIKDVSQIDRLAAVISELDQWFE